MQIVKKILIHNVYKITKKQGPQTPLEDLVFFKDFETSFKFFRFNIFQILLTVKFLQNIPIIDDAFDFLKVNPSEKKNKFIELISLDIRFLDLKK